MHDVLTHTHTPYGASLIWLCRDGVENGSPGQHNSGIAEPSCNVCQALEGQLISAVQRQQQLEGQLSDAQSQLAAAQQQQQQAQAAAEQLRTQLAEASSARDESSGELTAARQQVWQNLQCRSNCCQ